MTVRFAKYDKRYPGILLWETLENLPLFIGFLLAIRIRSENLALAFTYLLAGTALGVGLIHFTEVKKFSNQPRLKETLTNFSVFTALAIPFVFYFSVSNTWWSNWITDIILGVAAGYVLAIGESWGWSKTKEVKSHALTMAISAALFLSAIRLIYPIESMTAVLVAGTILTFLLSMIIVWLDYWPIKQEDGTSLIK
ncbi:MAG: hypothetical protein MUO77_12540 [Anaerolineales bacterium]|nr:hypothetical protein [Anaerolineales bacterium]